MIYDNNPDIIFSDDMSIKRIAKEFYGLDDFIGGTVVTDNNISEMIDVVKESICFFDDKSYSALSGDLIKNLKIIMNTASKLIYDAEIMGDRDYPFFETQNEEIIIKGIKAWVEQTEASLYAIEEKHAAVDREFERMMITVEVCGEEYICDRVLANIQKIKHQDSGNYERMVNFYHSMRHLWGEFDPTKNDYEHFEMAIRSVCNNIPNIRWYYSVLQDYRSKKIMYKIIKFWLTRNLALVDGMRDELFDDYFDWDVFGTSDGCDTFFVDCGAYDGDTAELFIKNYLHYSKIYLYDMVPVNIDLARKKLSAYMNIEYRNVGVTSEENAGKLVNVSDVHSGEYSLLDDSSQSNGDNSFDKTVQISLTTIDRDINMENAIGFLKMDIEGAEMDALKGAFNHIKKDKPRLAISLYHSYSHMWEIPKYIHQIRPDYKFYLRYYGVNKGLMTMDYVLLAV